MASVLVVEDDATVAEVTASYLVQAGHEVRVTGSLRTALTDVLDRPPDIVVLDLMLPDGHGLGEVDRLRAAGAGTILVVSALGSADDRIVGLERGVDDYLTKPFSPRELVLRVAALLRRAGPGPVPTQIRAGRLTVQLGARRVLVDGRELALTGREFDLLAFLVRHPGLVLSRAELMRQVWGWTFGDPSTVTVHVRRLREKVELDPVHPRLISTVWGVGYRFDLPETSGAG
jgi:two-component system response regulator ResD